MAKKIKYDRASIFAAAWRLIRRNGFSLSEALKNAWRNAKLRVKMHDGIARFWFQKVDGTLREAYGTLKESLVPQTMGTERRRNDTVQVYWDTEKQEWRCYKVANLVRIS